MYYVLIRDYHHCTASYIIFRYIFIPDPDVISNEAMREETISHEPLHSVFYDQFV
jgi:hypothetical protein